MNKKKTSKKNIPPIFHFRSFGEKAADKISSWVGSWPFIILFIGMLMAWISIIILLSKEKLELDHFLILNLFLSCVAAIQAPIILMSQNRASQKDRKRMEYDYLVNKRSEREIEKIRIQLDKIENKLNQKNAKL